MKKTRKMKTLAINAAEDVLKYMRRGDGIKASSGIYAHPLEGKRVCEACAVGAAAIAVTNGSARTLREKADGVRDAYESGGRYGIIDVASAAFTPDELNRMEAMFELDGTYNLNECPGEFLYYEDSETKRMRLIFQRVIDNDGRFPKLNATERKKAKKIEESLLC